MPRRLTSWIRSPLGWLVVASMAARGFAAALRRAPDMFPDEYIYSAISRGFVDTGLPTIRGHIAHFPAIMYPLLTSPAWLFHDVTVSYRVSQAIGVIAMSLVALPAYALARRVGCTPNGSLAVAAVSLACPDMIYGGWMLAETFAYPLTILTVYLSVRALDNPRWTRQIAAVSCIGVLILTRIQFVSLAAAYLVAVALVALRTRQTRFLQAHIPMFAAVVVLAIGCVVIGISSVAGYYAVALKSYPLVSTLAWFGRDALALLYASGWGLIPSALLGLTVMLRREATRSEISFSSLVLPFAVGLFAETASYSLSGRVQERYMFYLVPLLAIAGIRYYQRQMPWRPVHAALALALLIPSAITRLATSIFSHDKDGSPMLLGASWASDVLGLAVPDLLFLIGCVIALALALVPMFRPHRTVVVAVGSTLVLASALSVAAVGFDVRNTSAAGHHQNWVDAQGLGHIDLLSTSFGDRIDESDILFWNRSIKRVDLAPAGSVPDVFGAEHTKISPTGVISVDGHALRGPLLIEDASTTAEAVNATPYSNGEFTLWRPKQKDGVVRLGSLVEGRDKESNLGVRGRFDVWTQSPMRGYVSIHLAAYQSATRTARLEFSAGMRRQLEVVKPGSHHAANFPVCGSTHLSLAFRAVIEKNDFFQGATVVIGEKLLTVGASAPRYIPDASACPAKGAHN